jgi:drug/metabolite transporter (DMT)-like permease
MLLNKKLLAALLATCSALCLSIIMLLAKNLNPDIPTSLVVFVRSVFGLVFCITIVANNPATIFRTENLKLHILRAFLIVSTMLCTYYTYRNLPVAFATALGMTGALFTTILSKIILKDTIGFRKWVILFIGYLGVILVIRPNSFIIDSAIITALLANAFAASSIIVAKILSKKDGTTTIMLYSNIGLTIIAALVNTGTFGWRPLLMQDFGILALTGLFGILAQFCSITALKMTTPSFLAPFEYTRMIFAIVISIFIMKEIPDLYTMIGACIIIGSTYFLIKKNE